MTISFERQCLKRAALRDGYISPIINVLRNWLNDDLSTDSARSRLRSLALEKGQVESLMRSVKQTGLRDVSASELRCD